MEDSEVDDQCQSQYVEEEEHKSEQTPSKRLDLIFSVSKCSRKLLKMRVTRHLAGDSPVFMAAVLQYLTKEVLTTAGYYSKLKSKEMIAPSHLQRTMKEDEELCDLLAYVELHGPHPHLFKPQSSSCSSSNVLTCSQV